MADERIIERIKKVLELSLNNPSQEEAQAAALKAQELMAQYHISMKELDGVLDEPITEYEIEVASRKWKVHLASVVARNYACKVFTRGANKIVFYGYESDVQIAGNVFDMLFKVGNKNAKKEERRFKQMGMSTSGVFNTYCQGFVAGISHELDKQCTALQIIVPQEVEVEFENFKVSQGMKSHRVSMAVRNNQQLYQTGFADGRSAMKARDLEAV